MLVDPLWDKVWSDGPPAIGGYTNDPNMVELMANVGMDWFMIDQVFTANDWSRTELLLRTGEAAGITPMVRVPSNPWGEYDPRIATDVMRAIGVGANYILISHTSNREIEDAIHATEDWHYKALHIYPVRKGEDWRVARDRIRESLRIVPQPESKGSIDEIERTLSLPDVKLCLLALTDASRALRNSEEPDWRAPEVWDFVSKVVAMGRDQGVAIGANVGYTYDLGEMTDRAVQLREYGIRWITLQGPSFLAQATMTNFLENLDTKW